MRHSAIRVLTKEAESFPWFMVGDACTCSIAVCTVVFKPCHVFISTTTRQDRSFQGTSTKSRTCHLKIELFSHSPAILVRIGLSVRNSVLITSTVYSVSIISTYLSSRNSDAYKLTITILRPPKHNYWAHIGILNISQDTLAWSPLSSVMLLKRMLIVSSRCRHLVAIQASILTSAKASLFTCFDDTQLSFYIL